jgi:hypothetical protein
MLAFAVALKTLLPGRKWETATADTKKFPCFCDTSSKNQNPLWKWPMRHVHAVAGSVSGAKKFQLVNG